MKPRNLRDIESVPGFEHQGAKIKHADTWRKFGQWRERREIEAEPNVWHAHAGAAEGARREAFRQRAMEIEKLRNKK